MDLHNFTKTLNDLNNDQNLFSLLSEETSTVSETSVVAEANPKDLTLDTIVYVSQEQKNGEIKKYEFTICEVWLKPQNVWTILNIKKAKEEGNFWILFYDNGTYYLKKGIKGPIGVHVHLKH